MSYPKLFEPGKIGNLEIRNRIVMPAMGCSLAEVTGEPGPRMIRYYTDRAKAFGFDNYSTNRISLGYIWQLPMF